MSSTKKKKIQLSVRIRLLQRARLVLTHFLQPTSYKSIYVDVWSQDSSVAGVMGRNFSLREFSLPSNYANPGAQQPLLHWYGKGAPFSVSGVAVT